MTEDILEQASGLSGVRVISFFFSDLQISFILQIYI